jgi:hypothetical protein
MSTIKKRQFSSGINGTYFRMLDEYLLHDIYKYLFDGVMEQLIEKTKYMKYFAETTFRSNLDRSSFNIRMIRFRHYRLAMRFNGDEPKCSPGPFYSFPTSAYFFRKINSFYKLSLETKEALKISILLYKHNPIEFSEFAFNILRQSYKSKPLLTYEEAEEIFELKNKYGYTPKNK